MSAEGAPPRGRLDRFGGGLLAIALAGLVFRIAYVVATRDDTHLCNGLLCGDALFYSGQANTNAQGLWWRDFTDWHVEAADHPPLTAFVLTPVSWVLGTDPSPVVGQRLVMALLGAAVIVAVGLLGRKVAGERAGLLAAGIAAVNANFWMNDVLVMSETLGTLAIVLVLLAVYRYLDEPSARRAAVVGALVGVAGLARAELLLLLPVTFLPVVLRRTGQPVGTRLGRFLLAGVVGFAVLLPWTAYNLVRFEQPVLLSTNDGLTLVGANCDRVYGVDDPGGIGFWNLWCKSDADFFQPPGTTFADQSEQSAYYRRVGLDYIANHKRLLPKVVAVRVARGFGLYGPDQMVWLNQGEGRESWASWTGYVTWWLLLVPSVAGGVILWRRRQPVWPLASTAVIVLITVSVFYGIVRFRLPADVAAVVLTAVALDALWRRLRSAGPGTADEATTGGLDVGTDPATVSTGATPAHP